MDKFTPNKQEAARDFLNDQRPDPKTQKETAPYTHYDFARDVLTKPSAADISIQNERGRVHERTKFDRSAEKRQGDLDFVKKQQQERRKSLPSLPEEKPENLLPAVAKDADAAESSVAEFKAVAAGESVLGAKAEAVASLPEEIVDATTPKPQVEGFVELAAQIEKKKKDFGYSFLNVLSNTFEQGRLLRLEVYEKEDQVFIELMGRDGNSGAEISLENLEDILETQIINPFKDKKFRKPFRESIVMALKDKKLGLLPEDAFLEIAFRSSQNFEVVRTSQEVGISNQVNQEDGVAEDLDFQVRLNQKEKLKSHPFFRFLFSLNGSVSKYRISIIPRGEKTQVLIVDRTTSRAIESIKFKELEAVFGPKSLTPPFVGRLTPDFRIDTNFVSGRENFKEELVVGLKNIGVLAIPEVVILDETTSEYGGSIIPGDLEKHEK